MVMAGDEKNTDPEMAQHSGCCGSSQPVRASRPPGVSKGCGHADLRLLEPRWPGGPGRSEGLGKAVGDWVW